MPEASARPQLSGKTPDKTRVVGAPSCGCSGIVPACVTYFGSSVCPSAAGAPSATRTPHARARGINRTDDIDGSYPVIVSVRAVVRPGGMRESARGGPGRSDKITLKPRTLRHKFLLG